MNLLLRCSRQNCFSLFLFLFGLWQNDNQYFKIFLSPSLCSRAPLLRPFLFIESNAYDDIHFQQKYEPLKFSSVSFNVISSCIYDLTSSLFKGYWYFFFLFGGILLFRWWYSTSTYIDLTFQERNIFLQWFFCKHIFLLGRIPTN